MPPSLSLSSNSRKRQTRLTFSHLPDDSPGKQNAPDAIKDRVAGVSIDGSPLKHREMVNGATRSSSSSSPSPPPASSSQPTTRRGKKERPLGNSNRTSIFSSPLNQDHPKHKEGRASTRSLSLRKRIPLQEEENQEPVASSPPSALKSQLQIFDDEESDGDEIVTPATKRRRLASIANRNGRRNRDSDDSEADVVTPLKRQRRQTRASSFIDDEESSESNEVQANEDSENNDEETDDSERIQSSTKRRRRDLDQQKDDLDEDLEFLGESASVDTPRTLRKDKGTKLNLRQKALEKLKKRRHSQQQLTSSQGNESAPVVTHSTEEEDEDEVEEEDEENSSEESQQMDPVRDLDNDMEGFILPDEAGAEPVTLPFQFSSFVSKKPKEFFEIIVEWMVQRELNPEFAMDDERYTIAFQKWDDLAKALAGSKYISTAWVPEFTKLVHSRPNIYDVRSVNSEILHDRCDACNRANHPATFEVTFTGKPYDKKTLEQRDDDDDLLDEDTVFHLGRTCMKNARISHALAHWKFKVNELTVDWLKLEDHLTSDKLVERDSWSTTKRRKYAEDIVEIMRESGEIKRLYQDFKHLLEDAHTSQVGDNRFSP